MKFLPPFALAAGLLFCGAALADPPSVVEAGYFEGGGGAFLFLFNNSSSNFDDVHLLSVGGLYPGESADFGPVASMDVVEGLFGSQSGAFSADYDDNNIEETTYEFSATIGAHTYFSEPFSPSHNDSGHFVDFLGGPIPGAGGGDVDFSPVQVASLYIRPSGHSVPEPAAWALMLLGFFGAGAALRATRARTLPQA